MRIAFVDLLFSWPPHGGACTDLYHTAEGLKQVGHDVHLFMAQVPGTGERAGAHDGALPFPSTNVTFSQRNFTRQDVPDRIAKAVDAWKPDAVFVCDAFFLKPYLMEALSHYPLATRYYAYEASCPRDFRRFLNGVRCTNDYQRTPNDCRVCAVEGMGAELRSGHHSPWVEEFLAAQAYMPDYHRRLGKSLGMARAVVVYNAIQKDLLSPYNDHVFVVPGGVEAQQFAAQPPPENAERAIIVMTGRCEDPSKGVATLQQATDMLARTRSDFEVWATHPDPSATTEHFKALGWKPHDEIVNIYEKAAICVVPSLWEEPFGMVAVEAMAVGRPVVAARGGGLSAIIDDGVTGLLFEPGDAQALTESLGRLLDSSDLRAKMGRESRARVESLYDWPRIIERCYPPILERLAS
jgi:glycosyltransferase involved in cell wall biosynthesis